ncbi:MAG: glutamyl-tRNA reductase [Myxococcaceae bacterium]|nr:glutamyl-tRNA reductase [Myxococcaceae bacterium]MCI0672525.1 glutamyl-tRNA reductase [Myxococcaceae bacterium]
MELLCIGLSHKSAPVEVRERLAFGETRLTEALAELRHTGMEALWLSTCNRVEVYVAAEDAEVARARVLAQLASAGGEQALSHLYEHRGEAAMVHLFRVASSLDSMVLGEPQILGQVKDALELAQREGAARGELVRVCSAAFGTAKRVRTETAIGRSATSMASAAVELAAKIFGSLEGRVVLLVGAGEMGELAARHLAHAGAGRLLVCNRTRERAERLAAEVGAEVRDFAQLHAHLAAADVVVCSTASPLPLFTRESVAPYLKGRRGRPLFMVDLAVPRDIAPDVNSLDGVYAYDVDDIQKVVAENAAARAAEAERAQVIVAEEVVRYSRARALRDGVPVLAQLRARATEIASAEVERTLALLGSELTDKQRKSVAAMANAIVNKLLHQPTMKLRATGSASEPNRLADAAAELFGLDAADDVHVPQAATTGVRSGAKQ